MTDVVRVVVGTFGDAAWALKASWAVQSAVMQEPAPDAEIDVVHVHSDNLARARNLGAASGAYDFLIFLDADDTLHPGYVTAMLAGEGDLRQPATLGVHPDGHEDASGPVMIPSKPLLDGNYMVIGTMISREMWDATGGFDPTLPLYEDWDLFLRARLAGATVGHVPKAVYRVGVGGGRNFPDRAVQIHWYNVIRSRYAAEAHRLEVEKGWVL